MSEKNLKGGHYRWRILALLFAATTINYMDRSVINVLGPTLQYKVFGWSDMQYAYVNMAFKIAYAIGMLTMGAIIDKVGTRWGYTLSIGLWSVFGMLHAVVRPWMGWIGFAAARFGLGFGESGNFPACIKTVAEWFPKRERAFATGIFNAGSNVGAVLAPMIVPLIVAADGSRWQFGFLLTGAFSAVWVFAWLRTYRPPERHSKLSKAELDYINSDVEEHDKVADAAEKLPWRRVLPIKQTWAFSIGKITDAVWWFYLFWGGKFLYDSYGLSIKTLALPLVVIYLIADIGSVGGGWLSSYFIKRGWTINRARKVTLLLCAASILPVMFATQVDTKFTLTEEKSDVLEKEGVPREILSRIQPLSGIEFDNAKEFDGALVALIGKEHTANHEPAIFKTTRSNNWYWLPVFLIALAAASHQAWSANLFTLVSDVFPKKATASVVGVGGMMGAVAGLVADLSLGAVLEGSGPAGYFFAFLVAGSCYLIILGIIHIMMPDMRPLDENLKPIVR
jgi:ACS family hexuronate transporter-like MFS transporter